MTTHRLIAAMDGGPKGPEYVLLAHSLPWDAAIARWQALDDERRAGRLQNVSYLAVRADDDPDPRWAKARIGMVLRTPGGRLAEAFTSKIGEASKNLGKAVAKALGYEGREGGWIYNRHGQPICQGYASLAHRYGAHHTPEGWRLSATGLDRIVRQMDRQRAEDERAAARAAVTA